MSEYIQMKKPWSVVGAGFNDDGVYFTFDDNIISQHDVKLMQAAPDLLQALKAVVSVADRATVEFDMARAAISKATGE